VQVNDYVHIGAINSVKIGNNVLIASKVFISDHNHGFYGLNDRHDSPLSVPKDRELSFSSVVIEDNVWLGEFVAVLPGVTIGKGSIIGSMSVVSKNIPEFSIAVGSPAKVIKKYNFETSKWQSV
jgi:lipopolysaccharide O-acetyltransferase